MEFYLIVDLMCNFGVILHVYTSYRGVYVYGVFAWLFIFVTLCLCTQLIFAEICIKVVTVQKYCTLKTGYIFLL